MSNQITVEQIDAVLPFLEVFETPGFSPGEMHIEEGRFPWFEESEDVIRFVEEVYENNLFVQFDWSSWQEEAEKYFESPEGLSSANLDTIRKLLTTHVRKDRFCEGHLAAMFESGHIVAILRRLQDIRREMND